MSDYMSSMAQINARIATVQARFGLAPTKSSATAPTLGSTSGPTATFDSLVDRLLEPTHSGGAVSGLLSEALISELVGEAATSPTLANPLSSNGSNTVSTLSPAVVSVDPPATQAGTTSGGDIVSLASNYLGVPYVWGGEDPSGFDCSGLVQYAYGKAGVSLPRVARDQATVGTPVASIAEAVPGDLIAFGSPVDHIGIYAGDGKMVVAPHTGDVVKIQSITRTPVAIRRILSTTGAGATTTNASNAANTATSGATATDAAAQQYRPLFMAASQRYGVSADLLEAVAKTESSFDASAVSGAGAQGLMQLMPSTAKALGVDPFDPAQAIDGSARLLSQHLRKFGSVSLALAAYNAGPTAVKRYGGVPPYRETQNYVRKILADLDDATTTTAATSTAASMPTYSLTSQATTSAAARLLASATTATTPTATTPATTPATTAATTAATTPTATTATTTAATTATKTATTATGATTAAGKAEFVPTMPTGTPVSPAKGAWGPNTQMQVSSVGGENTISWGASGLLEAASPAELSAAALTVKGPVAKGVLKILRDATAIQLASKEFRQTLNDVNRDALGDPTAPDVIPVDPATAKPATTTAPTASTATTTAATTPTATTPASTATTVTIPKVTLTPAGTETAGIGAF